MKADVKRRWVKALRSGRYKQAYGFLRSPKGNERGHAYCCLGVLRLVCGRPKDHYEDQHSELLSTSLCDAVGLNPATASKVRKSQGKLAALNDRGRSFEQIANYIERYL